LELQETSRNDFFVEDDPIMQSATDALMLLSKVGKIYLKAEGNLIPNAVSIANIIVENFLKNNSKVELITLDSKISPTDGIMTSNIEIVLLKN
jgi:DNA-binding protein Alba